MSESLIPNRWLDRDFAMEVKRISDSNGGPNLTPAGLQMMKDIMGAKKVKSTGGASKAVFIPEDMEWVVKVVHTGGKAAKLDNTVRREVETIYLLKSRFPKYSQYLPSCLYLDHGVGVMRKYLVDINKFSTNRKQIKEIGAVLGIVLDLHEYNVGWLGDKFFFIDVGHDLKEV